MESIKVGLLGYGTIGTGVIRVFQQNAELLQQRLGKPVELVMIADLDIASDRGVDVDPGLLTTDVEDVISNPDVDVVIELIGGYEPAKSFIIKAINNGKHIVTANKALMAVHGQEILALPTQMVCRLCLRQRSVVVSRSFPPSRRICAPIGSLMFLVSSMEPVTLS